MEKIGIVGSGNMARALGVRFVRLGHSVLFGGRDPVKAAELAVSIGDGAHGGSTDAAVQFGDLVLWTVREPDPSKVLANPGLLAGKIIMDLNNRDYAHDVQHANWFAESLAERLQRNAPDAKVVKVFNTLAMEAFDTDARSLSAVGAQTFTAGNDDEAKRRVSAIAKDLGLETVDLGAGSASFRAAEALGDVIRLLMIGQNRGTAAHLKVIELPAPALGIIGDRKSSNYA